MRNQKDDSEPVTVDGIVPVWCRFRYETERINLAEKYFERIGDIPNLVQTARTRTVGFMRCTFFGKASLPTWKNSTEQKFVLKVYNERTSGSDFSGSIIQAFGKTRSIRLQCQKPKTVGESSHPVLKRSPFELVYWFAVERPPSRLTRGSPQKN